MGGEADFTLGDHRRECDGGQTALLTELAGLEYPEDRSFDNTLVYHFLSRRCCNAFGQFQCMWANSQGSKIHGLDGGSASRIPNTVRCDARCQGFTEQSE